MRDTTDSRTLPLPGVLPLGKTTRPWLGAVLTTGGQFEVLCRHGADRFPRRVGSPYRVLPSGYRNA